MTFSVVIPTCGRETLRRTLRSIAAQSKPPEEVIVVGDGEQPVARAIFEEERRPGWRYEEHGPTRLIGNAQREHGIALARGDYLSFMDDDDVYEPDAFSAIRAAVAEHPGRPLVFRMDQSFGAVLWRTPALTYGNVGTPMFVVPRLPGLLAPWRTNDFDFIAGTVALQGKPVWREEVIARIRPVDGSSPPV